MKRLKNEAINLFTSNKTKEVTSICIYHSCLLLASFGFGMSIAQGEGGFIIRLT